MLTSRNIPSNIKQGKKMLYIYLPGGMIGGESRTLCYLMAFFKSPKGSWQFDLLRTSDDLLVWRLQKGYRKEL
jgi:hypothetical protein